MKTALTIAGSDSSGGAGIQADMKTMTANGVYAMSAVTALTAQNTTGVTDILESTPHFLSEQLDAIFTDIFPDAVKIGMVSSADLIVVNAEKLKQYKEKNIVVESFNQGNVTDLEANVLAAAQGKVGAAALPNLYSGYADMAYDLDLMGKVVDLAPYLTAKEKAAYVDGFLSEGDLMNNGELKIFPVAKSTELMFFNDTDWQRFSKDTFVRYGALSTMEGVTTMP